jgi:hypothetical protein
MHIDVWVAGTAVPGQVVQLIVQNFNEDGSFSNNLFYNIDLGISGVNRWYSADIPFTDFTAGNKYKQVQVVGAGPSAFSTTYRQCCFYKKCWRCLMQIKLLSKFIQIRLFRKIFM